MEKIDSKKIAKLAGVSPTTVSRVINNEKYVREKTKEKVLKIINELGYTPDFFARGLRIKKSKTIGLIVGDIENPYYSRMAKGIIKVCEESNYNVIVCNSNYEQKLGEKYIDMLLSKRVDGLLISTIQISDESINKLKQKDILFVAVTCKFESKDINYITGDDYYGGLLAMNYLVKLGHKKIFFLRGSEVSGGVDRLRAYKDVLAENNIELNNNLISKPVKNEEYAYYEIKGSLKKDLKFTAIMAENDFLAIGAMKAILEFGLNIPEDISLIGYDDLNISSVLKVPLTTVKQPKLYIGELSARRLIKLIESPAERQKPEQLVLKPELVIRDSCRKID